MKTSKEKNLTPVQIPTKVLTTLALLVAMNAVLNDGFAIRFELLKFNFGFITVIMAGVLYGPWASMAVGAMGDVLGLLIFPVVGTPNPIFTIIAGVNGLIYGLCLYSKKREFSNKELLIRSAVAAFLVTQVMYTVVNSLVLSHLYGLVYIVPTETGYELTAVMITRIFKNFFLFYINMMVIPVVFECKQRIQKFSFGGTVKTTV
ncbi:MAG: folate family ECF transporter S component [Eubacteriales bacterium]